MTHAHPDHRSPWVIDIRAVGLAKASGAGFAHPLEITGPSPDQTVAGVLGVGPETLVTVVGRAESVAEGVLVSASIDAVATGTCSRCLTEIELPISTSFRELFAYPDSYTAETTDPDEIPRIDDEKIDLEPVVHDELVLAMPTIPLCREDCPGLCPECGERLDSVGADHRHEILDPRWAGLAGRLDASGPDSAQ